MRISAFIPMPELLASVLLLVGCTTDSPTLTENPYKDDYSALTPVSNKSKWGAANVHDPSVIKTDSFYYVYSTDAYYIRNGIEFNDTGEKIGNIPIRRSADLVRWEFVDWALDSIPPEAVRHVHEQTGNRGADNIWAPYIYRHGDIYRLYYCVSSFGANTSYIGMAESASPEGPFTDKGMVVSTTTGSEMNAIDPSLVKDQVTGRLWMHYGSYFGGLYALEIDENTGFALHPGDQGHLVATREDRGTRIIEAPEIIYNPELKQYFLFVSYEPLFSFYNIRVGHSVNPDGPFYDWFGHDMADSTNNFPILTHSYMFENHPGWSGNGHCAILNDGGRYFVLHQGRLAPNNNMMLMHVREIKWLSSGWPVFSPERYAGLNQRAVRKKELYGTWEIIHLRDIPEPSPLWQGQVSPGGWTYSKEAFNVSRRVEFLRNGSIDGAGLNTWVYNGEYVELDGNECAVFTGWDWENECETILLSGILKDGTSIWAKKIAE